MTANGLTAQELIGQALTSTVFGNPAATKVDVARYFNPGYTQVTDGSLSNFSDFVAHITHLRTTVTGGRIEVLDALREGNLIADRHHVRADHADGSSSSFEVLLIGELDDQGRFLRVVETTRQLTGDPAHADLGRAAAV